MGSLPRSLSIIGCGKTGQTLARLLVTHGIFSIRDIVTASPESAERAVSFVGSGDVCNSVSALRSADLFMVTTPDSHIAAIVRELLAHGAVREGAVVFHCSGAYGSDLLAGLRDRGAAVASVHPVKSFSEPSLAVVGFTGTYCGVEGDERAVTELSRAFEAIGGRIFKVNAESKPLYHAAFVFSCNYLTALLECALQCSEKAGIDRAKALEIVAPLVRETTEAVLSSGAEAALTGPVVRGDAHVVAEQLAQISSWRSDYGEIYRLLGHVALEIASRGGALQGEDRARIQQSLMGPVKRERGARSIR
jgi:predicted short-subunit dehydrogenase-like oxidoreductase (DUF2520 family)